MLSTPGLGRERWRREDKSGGTPMIRKNGEVGTVEFETAQARADFRGDVRQPRLHVRTLEKRLHVNVLVEEKLSGNF